MIQKPQIIVIPQNMLSEQSKSLLRLQQQSLKSNNRMVLPNLTNVMKPTAAVVGNLRPSPASSPDIKQEVKRSLSPVSQDENGPVRKRANLDHLSSEERLMRRKLKNREAAQTARDKKKAYIDELEARLERMEKEKMAIIEQNRNLISSNADLQLQNTTLVNRNKELELRIYQNQNTDMLPLSPESQPRTPSPALSPAPSPSTDAAVNLTPPEPAVLSPLPQESGVRSTGSSSLTDLGLSSSDLTTWSTSCVLQQMLMWSVMILSLTNSKMSVLSATKSSTASYEAPPAPTQQQQQQLPPKKRNVWSDPQSWDPPPPDLKSPPLE